MSLYSLEPFRELIREAAKARRNTVTYELGQAFEAMEMAKGQMLITAVKNIKRLLSKPL